MSIFKRLNVYVYDMDDMFMRANNDFCKYIIERGFSTSFDFENKDFQKLYIHFFLKTLCDFIISNPNNTKTVFYANIHEMSDFHKNTVKKVKKIFGFRIWEGIWKHADFIKLLKDGTANLVDKFELFVRSETKPKTFKHIKKYLEKEGLKELGNSYFKDLANKMAVCG